MTRLQQRTGLDLCQWARLDKTRQQHPGYFCARLSLWRASEGRWSGRGVSKYDPFRNTGCEDMALFCFRWQNRIVDDQCGQYIA